MEPEVWKRYYIKGEETKYEISSYGNYRSSWGRMGSELLKINKNEAGYPQAYIYHKGKRYTVRLHRMVAQAFIPNPHNYEIVNHLDGVKDNGYFENLEWCTRKRNTKHAYDIGIKVPVKGKDHYKAKEVCQILNGKIIKTYETLSSTSKDGFTFGEVSRAALHGGRHKGFHWKYSEDIMKQQKIK